VDLSGVYAEVYAPEYLLPADLHVQVDDLK